MQAVYSGIEVKEQAVEETHRFGDDDISTAVAKILLAGLHLLGPQQSSLTG